MNDIFIRTRFMDHILQTLRVFVGSESYTFSRPSSLFDRIILRRRVNASIGQEFATLRAVRLARLTKKVSMNLKDGGQGWVGRADPNREQCLYLDNYIYYKNFNYSLYQT